MTAIKYGIVLVVLVAAYWTALFLVQRRLLYPAPVAYDHGSPPLDTHRTWLGESTEKTEAWLLPALPTNQPPFALLIYGHGNGELIEHWARAFDQLRWWGLAVLLVEYPGYGRSEGQPSEAAIQASFLAAYDWAVENADVNPDKIVGYGRSLGGGAVANLSQDRPLAALILESTFTSVRPFARRFLAPGFLVRDVFDTVGAVADFDGPLMVLHGVDDAIIPVTHGRRLAHVGGVALHELRCGHNDCPRPWSLIRQFLVKTKVVPKS